MSDVDSIQHLSELVRDFANRRHWSQFHDPKNLVMALASEVGELSALLRWVPNSEADRAVRTELHERFQAEIGDVGILLLALCARAQVDLGEAVRTKLAVNEQRYPVELVTGKAERPE